MKLFGNILLAGLLSLIVGVGVTLALSAIVPCYSDKAGCGMGEAFRLFFVPGFALLAMIAFAITAAGKNRERPLWRAMLTLLLVPICLMMFAVGSDMMSGRATAKGDLLDSIQATLSFWSVVLVQWQVVLRYLRKRDMVQQVAS